MCIHQQRAKIFFFVCLMANLGILKICTVYCILFQNTTYASYEPKSHQ